MDGITGIMENSRRQRIPDAEWESHRAAIQRLYVKEDKPLVTSGGVIDIMKEEHGFSASKAQYETRLKKWGFRKYSKKADWTQISNEIDSRKLRGKETEVFIGGEQVQPNRIRKQMRRHQKQKAGHPYSQIQCLPSYIRVTTPPMCNSHPTQLHRPSSPLPSSSRSYSQSSSSFAIANIPLRLSPLFQDSQTTSIIGSRYNETPSSHHVDSFALSWDFFCGNTPSLAQFRTSEPSNSFANLDHPVDFLEPNDLASLDTDLATITPLSWIAATRDTYNIPDFLTSMTPMFIRMLPIVEPFMRSMRFLKEEAFNSTVEGFYHANTSQLLCRESVDLQILHVIFYRLVNDDDAVRALESPRKGADKLFKAGVEHIFSLGARLINEFLDSTPCPYRLALEQGLFRVAIEMGAGRTLQTILERGFDPSRLFIFDSRPIYPLERTCCLQHLEATRILLEFGADPNVYALRHPLVCRRNSFERTDQKSPVYSQLIRLLLYHGAVLEPHEAPNVLDYCDSEEVLLLVSHFIDRSFETFIETNVLPSYFTRIGWDHYIHLSVKTILEHGHPSSVKNSWAWQRFLSSLLCSAALGGRTEAIDLLLAKGAQPKPNCLIGAVRNNDMKLVERFLDLGLDPNIQSSLQVYSRNGNHFSMDEECTALSESIQLMFKKAFSEFERRGFLSQVAKTESSYLSALTAACNVGDSALVRDFLGLRKLKWTYSLRGVVAAAVKANQEDIVKQLLFDGIVPDRTSLILAVKGKHLTLTQLLVNMVDLNETPNSHNELDGLCQAIRWGDLECVRFFIKAGIPVNHLYYVDFKSSQHRYLSDYLNPRRSRPSWRVTPLSLAILEGNCEAIELLMMSGATVNVNCSEGDRGWCLLTPLTACVCKRNPELLHEFLRRGADPFDNNAIYVAIALGLVNTVKVLSDAFAKRYPGGMKLFGSEALSWAANVQNIEMLELLAQVVDTVGMFVIRAQPFESKWVAEGWLIWCSPLSETIRSNCEQGGVSQVLAILLHHVKDINTIVRVEGSHKVTPLLYAIELESLETVRILIKAGADKSLPALWGISRTPLQAAAEVGNRDIVEYLLNQGVDVNEPPAPRGGATALQLASIKGYIGIATMLLDKGANVNAERAMLDGRTAFEGATEHGRIDMMLFLVQNGADLLSNDGQQYRRAVRFAELNAQHAGKEFAEQLFEMATRNNRPGQIGGGDSTMPEFDVCNFDDLFPHD